MQDLLPTFAYAALVFLAAGTVKGVVGMGLPTTAIAFMTIVVDPRMAMSLALIPMVTSNAWQLYRSGGILGAARRYGIFLALLVVTILITLWLSSNAPQGFLLGALGAVILIYVALTFSRWAPNIPAHRDRAAQVIAGTMSGIMGGLVAVWAPPMGAYLAARNTTKDEFVRATGFLLFLGSIPLTIGYVRQGFLTSDVAWMGIALLVPTFAGFALGEKLRTHVSEAGFRRVILVFFALMGLNLLRRAIVA